MSSLACVKQIKGQLYAAECNKLMYTSLSFEIMEELKLTVHSSTD